MKVLIFLSMLTRGGAARVTCTLCHEMVKAGYEVHVATNTETAPMFYQLPPEAVLHKFYVPKRGVGLWSSLKMNIGYCSLSKNIIKEVNPDVVIGVEPRVFVYARIGCWMTRKPIIACDHTSFTRKQDWMTNFTRYRFYGTADALTILTKKDYHILGKKFPLKRVIYNPLSFPILDHQTERKQNILCAGRLDVWYIKGFDTILDCWQRIASKYPDWVLEIAGDGTTEVVDFLKQTINQKGLSDRVQLLGQIENMQEKLSTTSIFALPSRVEGFPMVLMEAMSQGCACVAYEVGGATYEMINNEEDGLIIPDADIDSFVKGLSRLIENAELRDKLAKNALVSIQRFSPSSFMKSWEKLIEDVINRG